MTDTEHETHNRENDEEQTEKNTETAQKPPELTQIDRENSEVEIEKFLGEFTGSGAKISLYRRAPMWCSGFCEQYPLDDAISLEDIRDTWGGRRFELRILNARGVYVSSRHVTIADVPRFRGRALDDSMTYDKGGQVIVKNPAAETAEKALEALERAQQRNQDLMIEMMKISQKSSAPAPATADPTAQLHSVIEIFKTMKDFAQDAAPEVAGASEGMGAKDYLEIARMFKDEIGERRKVVAAAAEPKRIQLPAATAPPAAQLPTANPAPIAPVAQEPDDDDDDGPTIADELAEAGPETAAQIMADAFDRWTDEQKQEAIGYFTGQANNRSNDENTSIDDPAPPPHNPSEVKHGEEEEDKKVS